MPRLRKGSDKDYVITSHETDNGQIQERNDKERSDASARVTVDPALKSESNWPTEDIQDGDNAEKGGMADNDKISQNNDKGYERSMHD